MAGRDATDPQLLVALWLYACTRGIGSSRGLAKAKCMALWCALAYNILHFGAALLGYSGFDSAVYRNLNAERHFPQENATLHNLNMATFESKPL